MYPEPKVTPLSATGTPPLIALYLPQQYYAPRLSKPPTGAEMDTELPHTLHVQHDYMIISFTEAPGVRDLYLHTRITCPS